MINGGLIMKYSNPVITGFYPDPSVCKARDRYYLVCSSMQYFPGVPLFESRDLINWKQIGHCLTRPNQIALEKVNSSGGVFAPTIRFHNERFYMTTTNDTTRQNFYLYTDDIYGEWSDPIYVDQGGIDPSLFFEDGKTYFLSNGADDKGVPGIVQCEIDILTGEKLTTSRTIWQGSGGRYLEGPHMYHIGEYYYLVAAEGGTEYGHMVTYARGKSPDGEFISYESNPVLTNRNLGGYEIQGIGHGDLIEDKDGNWWMLHLGFRQTGQWTTFHHLGREVFLTPVEFHNNGWFTAGEKGTVRQQMDVGYSDLCGEQLKKKVYTFENTDWNLEWCYLRIPNRENYEMGENFITLKGTRISLNDADSPTFIGLRQKEFNAIISCDLTVDEGEAGITIYMDEKHHYDLAIQKSGNKYEVIERLNIGAIKSIQHIANMDLDNEITLIIYAENQQYTFAYQKNGIVTKLGTAETRYLSSEVAGGFTGVMIGLYASGNNSSVFSDFKCEYLDE